jgi:phosphoserine phosphatase
VLKGDVKSALAGGERALVEMAMATHAGMTSDEFTAIVNDWLATARHPQTKRPFTEMVYQPMLEVLAYLRANGFKTFIVSGGGIEFMRPWTERVYGIPPEQVIGSSIKTKFEMRENGPVLVRLPEINFIDDKAGKPVGIQQHIGRRPIAAFGNSDGDLQMLQWTAAGPGPRFCLYVHHTDAEREWAYDRQSHIGQLDKGLDEAVTKGWSIADMKRDWKAIYPPLKTSSLPNTNAECCETTGGRAALLLRQITTPATTPAALIVPVSSVSNPSPERTP